MKPNYLKQTDIPVKQSESQERKVLPVCFLCGQVPEQGLRNGFFLRGVFICCSCEAELITAQAQEKKEYLRAISKLRQILFKE